LAEQATSGVGAGTTNPRVVSEKRVGAYQPVVTMGFWMMGKLKTRIVIGYIFAWLLGACVALCPLQHRQVHALLRD